MWGENYMHFSREAIQRSYNLNYSLPLRLLIPPGNWGFSADFLGYLDRMAETIEKIVVPRMPRPRANRTF